MRTLKTTGQQSLAARKHSAHPESVKGYGNNGQNR
jgi:hypothetical protein